MSLTQIKFLDAKILLQIPFSKILTFFFSNKYFHDLISDSNFMFQIIERDFNSKLASKIPENISPINYHFQLNQIIFYNFDIKFIQFLISTKQDKFLFLFCRRYACSTHRILTQLIRLKDLISIKYLIDIKLFSNRIIEDMIQYFSLEELLTNLSLLQLKMQYDISELKSAIMFSRFDIIKHIIANNPALLEDRLRINGLIDRIMDHHCPNIEIFQYFRPHVDNVLITIKLSVVYLSQHCRDSSYLKFICEEYNILDNMSLQDKKIILNASRFGTNVESLEYIFYKIYPPDKKINPLYLLFKYIRKGDIKMVKSTMAEIDKKEVKNNIMKKMNKSERFINEIKLSCIIGENIQIMQFIFERFNIDYTNDLLNLSVKILYPFNKNHQLYQFLIQEKNLKFDTNNVDFILSGGIYIAFRIIEYMLDNYEIQPVPENIVQKCISFYEEKRLHKNINQIRIKKLTEKYL